MARRRNPASATASKAAVTMPSHTSMILLVGGLVGGAYLMAKNKQKAATAAQVAANQALTNATAVAAAANLQVSTTTPVAPDPDLTPDSSQFAAPVVTYNADGTTSASQYITAPTDPNATPDDSSDTGVNNPLLNINPMGMNGLGAFPWHQPSGSLPGMGSYHRQMLPLRTGGRVRGQLAGFNQVFAFNPVIAAPIANLSGSYRSNGMGGFFSSVSSAVKAAVAAPAAVVQAIAAPVEKLTGAHDLKVPLAILTGGGSLVANAATKVVAGTVTDVTKVLLKPLNKIGGSQQAQTPTATTDCNGYAPGQVQYEDVNGNVLTCATFMNYLNQLQAATPTAINVQPVGTNPAIFMLPAALTAQQITQANSSTTTATTVGNGYPLGTYLSIPSTTQVNPLTGVAYPYGTPINPATGAAYINPASNTAWPAGTTIDQVTGQPVGAINPATGVAYPAIYVPVSGSATSYTAPLTTSTGSASGSGYTSVYSTIQINPATGVAYPAGTPINPSTGAAYINPATGTAWPAYTVIDQTTGQPVGAINPATGTYYPAIYSPVGSPSTSYAATSTTINPSTGQPYVTSVASTTQINPATGIAYPVGTPINPTTNLAYINPATGTAWPAGTVIDQTTGYPIGAINPATGVPYGQTAASGAYNPTGPMPTGYDMSSDTSFTDPSSQYGGAPQGQQGGGGIDPATGIPYSQEQQPAAAAATPAAPVAAPSKPVNWWMVGGAAVGVPALMYFMHK